MHGYLDLDLSLRLNLLDLYMPLKDETYSPYPVASGP